MTERPLTVIEATLIDAQQQKQAFDEMAKRIKPAGPAFEPGDLRLLPDTMEALAGTLRLELTFTDPIETRQQLEVLAAAIVEAQVISQDHGLGINRQRLRMRQVMQTAAETLVFMQGKTPSRLYHRHGRRPGRRVKESSSSSS